MSTILELIALAWVLVFGGLLATAAGCILATCVLTLFVLFRRR